MEDLVDSEKPKTALNKIKRRDAKEHLRNMDFFFFFSVVFTLEATRD